MRKSITLVTAALAVAVLVSACGGGEQTPTPTTPPTVRLEATPTPTLAPTAPAAASPTPPDRRPAPLALGKSLAARNGCASCHSPTGVASIGPTWQGLYGKERELADGSTVVADEEYLRESIVDPNAKIVKGFSAGIMPQDFGEKLSEGDIEAIIAYIKSLE